MVLQPFFHSRIPMLAQATSLSELSPWTRSEWACGGPSAQLPDPESHYTYVCHRDGDESKRYKSYVHLLGHARPANACIVSLRTALCVLNVPAVERVRGNNELYQLEGDAGFALHRSHLLSARRSCWTASLKARGKYSSNHRENQMLPIAYPISCYQACHRSQMLRRDPSG